jgi:hypothetical protein
MSFRLLLYRTSLRGFAQARSDCQYQVKFRSAEVLWAGK